MPEQRQPGTWMGRVWQRGAVAATWLFAVLCFPSAWSADTVHAQEAAVPKGVELYNRYQALVRRVTALENSILELDGRLLPAYECPPATPNKEGHEQELRDLYRVRVEVRRMLRYIEDQRTILGIAGEGQAGDLDSRQVVTDNQIQTLERRINRTVNTLGALSRKLQDTPKTKKDCSPQANPLASITATAASVEPGQQTTIKISGTLADGNPAIIDSATVVGLGAIGTEQAHGGAGTGAYTIDFKVADVRRQGPFNISVTATGRDGGVPAASGTNARARITFTVKNVAPTITAEPGDQSADPGDQLAYTGQIKVVDKNADAVNRTEITAGSLTMTHPSNLLETMPGQAFSRLGRVRRISHDASTGEYVFQVDRSATVKTPHRHGRWSTDLTVTDSDGASANQAVAFKVHNVAPTVTVRVKPRRHFRAGDGIPVEIQGVVRDENGRDDIEDGLIDAQAAGGLAYDLHAGSISVLDEGKFGYTFSTNPTTFPHTANPGQHNIPVQFADGGTSGEEGDTPPLEAKVTTFIKVGNEAPKMDAYGYI